MGHMNVVWISGFLEDCNYLGNLGIINVMVSKKFGRTYLENLQDMFATVFSISTPFSHTDCTSRVRPKNFENSHVTKKVIKKK